jgi:hypothetical protein
MAEIIRTPHNDSEVRRTYGRPLQAMLVVVGVVLLIACSNIACLLLARAPARNRDVAVRLAIGASRWRLVRQLLSEWVLLSLAGALLGLLLARWSFGLLVGFISAPLYTTVPGVSLDFTLDWRILGFTTGVAVLASILFAVVPSILSTRAALISAMKGYRADEAEHRSVFRPARWIVALEVSLSLVLLVVSGLFLKSFWKLATLDVGFDARNVFLVKVDLDSANVPESLQSSLREQILARLRAVPGVASASQSVNTPISGFFTIAPIGIRMAVGAGRGAIVRLVLHDVGVVLFLGCCTGVLLALGTTRLLATLLFGVEPRDFATLPLCVTMMATTGPIAAYLPARRASRLDAGAVRGVKTSKLSSPWDVRCSR